MPDDTHGSPPRPRAADLKAVIEAERTGLAFVHWRTDRRRADGTGLLVQRPRTMNRRVEFHTFTRGCPNRRRGGRRREPAYSVREPDRRVEHASSETARPGRPCAARAVRARLHRALRRRLPGGRRPADAAQVAEVVRLCAEHGAPVVPQGGNTGVVGGGVPRGGEVLVSTARLTKIGTVDENTGHCLVGGA